MGTSGTFTGSAILSRNDVRFLDIAGNWAKSFIEKIAMFGIVDNADYFRPQDTVTRAEILKIIGNAAGWNVSGAAGGTFPANSPDSDLNDTDFEDLFPSGTGSTDTGT